MPRPLAIEILDAIVSTYRGHRAHADGPTEQRDFEVGEFSRLDIAGPSKSGPARRRR
jgi:hypothetical protein